MGIIRRHLIFLIFMSAVVMFAVSCAERENEQVPANTASEETDAVTTPPVFKEKDFGGNDFTFLTYNEHATNYVDEYIWSESSEPGTLSEAVIKRNSETEAMFNIKITTDEVYLPKTEATGRIQAGQCDFDVIYEWGTNSSSLALDGLLIDFNELETVDLNRSYWVPSAKDDLNISGKTFIATNYITMNSIDWSEMLYYNKSMYEDLGYTDSLYDSVISGNWTIDQYVSIAVSATDDLNGDDTMTASDRYGIWGSINDCLTGLVRSSGVENTVKNNDGSYSLDVYNEKIVSIYTDYEDKLSNNDNFITYEDIWQEQPNLTDFATRAEGARFLGFGEGHVLFMPGTLSLSHEFEDMQDDYGILPNPKYNVNQARYYHFADCNAPMLSVPAVGTNTDETGLVLEYMAYKSEQYLLPAYCKSVTENKTTPDSNDKKMLNIIKNSVRYEWTELYALNVTNSITDKMMVEGSFKSVYSRLYSKAMAEINGCVNTLAFIGLE